MRAEAEFWTLAGAPPDRMAIVTAAGTDISYAVLRSQIARFADEYARLANTLSTPRLLIALEIGAEVGIIAAYLAALTAGHPVILGEDGTFADGSPLVVRYRPNLIVRARERSVEMTPFAQTSVALHADLRLMLSTSGTTGDPKLVRLSAANIASNAAAIAQYLGLGRDDRAFTSLPLHYSYGLSVLHSHLHAGGSLVLSDLSVSDPDFRSAFCDAAATGLALVPHQIDLLDRARFQTASLATLRHVTQAGGRLDPAVARTWSARGVHEGWRFYVMYGQTEAGPRMSYVPPDAMPEAADTIGVAIPGGRLWLVDDTGAPVAATGVPGELIYEGPNVMMGYAQAPAEFSDGQGPAQLHTGDVAVRTASGHFRIVGRMKRFVKLFGLRLSLDQIEAHLGQVGIAAHAAAVDDRLVILHRDRDQGLAAQRAVANAYDLPLGSVTTAFLADVPLLSSGKTDQQALTGIAKLALAQPKGATVDDIAVAMAQATRVQQVGPEDSFLSLGGDSLGYLQVQMTLESRLGFVPDRWEAMPLRELETLAVRKMPGRMAALDSDIALRVLAIVAVVAQHATDYALFGGTWVLILLMGYSFGRFQSPQLAEGRWLSVLRRLLYPIVPLYVLILAAYTVLRPDTPEAYFYLAANYMLEQGGRLVSVLWFVSLYAQLVVVVAGAGMFRAVRSALDRGAWQAVVVALVVSLAAVSAAYIAGGFHANAYHGATVADLPVPHVASRGLLECLPIFLLGWALQSAVGLRARLVTVLAGAVVVLMFPSDQIEPVVALGLGVIILAANTKLRLPGAVQQAVVRMASVSMFVYLMHQFVVHALREVVHAQRFLAEPVLLVVAVAVSFAVAFAAKYAFDRVDRMVTRLWPIVLHLPVAVRGR